MINWWRVVGAQESGIDQRLLFAVPNGGSRNIAEAHRLVQAGVVAGVPDLFLACPRGAAAGLWIEMKRRQGGRVSEEQAIMLQLLAEVGYRVVICKGSDEAITEIENYLNKQKNETERN